MPIRLNAEYLEGFADEQGVLAQKIWAGAEGAFDKLINRSGEGSDSLGWVDWPVDYDKQEFAEIKKAAGKLKKSEVVVVIGIGGSYLGSRAGIEFILSPVYNNIKKDTPEIYFLGNSISSDNISEIKAICEERDFSLIVISKSGTTTEPAIIFRILRGLLEGKYGEQASERIFAITEYSARSKLKEVADLKRYQTFRVPENVGGRYSVLTAVGLLPMAAAGIDIAQVMQGAADAREKYLRFSHDNDAVRYAVLRNILYGQGKSIEIMAAYEPAFAMMNEWWKQLFGESEGKAGKGIFPAYADYTADLHSLEQYIQEGERTLMETFVTFETPRVNPVIPGGSLHDDKISALAGMGMHEFNRSASEAVKKAHIDGGVPVLDLGAPSLSAASFGALAYFFQRSCAISALISGVTPFGQPGVEAYKKNMFAILGL